MAVTESPTMAARAAAQHVGDCSNWARARAAGAALTTTTQLGGLSTTQVGAFSTTGVAAISSTQIGLLTLNQIGGLIPTELSVLTQTQLAGLSTTDIGALTTGQVVGLSPGQIYKMYLNNNSGGTASGFTATQVQNFTILQYQAYLGVPS